MREVLVDASFRESYTRDIGKPAFLCRSFREPNRLALRLHYFAKAARAASYRTGRNSPKSKTGLDLRLGPPRHQFRLAKPRAQSAQQAAKIGLIIACILPLRS